MWDDWHVGGVVKTQRRFHLGLINSRGINANSLFEINSNQKLRNQEITQQGTRTIIVKRGLSMYLVLLSVLVLTSTQHLHFTRLSHLLDTLDEQFYSEIQDLGTRVDSLSRLELGQYVCLYGKAALYGMLTKDSQPNIQLGYYFVKLAAQFFEVTDCMHLLGVMSNFKMTPHFAMESLTRNQDVKQYVKKSHIKNSELYWYMASIQGNMLSTMVLGNLNHIGLSTKINCTTAAMYYRMIIDKVFVQSYDSYSYYRDRGSMLEEELYLKRELKFPDQPDDAYMIEESISMGQESYTSNFNLAQNYYYGRNGFLRNTTKAAEMFGKLKEVGNLESAALLGLCYFKGEGVNKNYQMAYTLFRTSKNSQLSKYMINVMQYHGIHVKKDRASVLKRLKSQIKQSHYAKSFYGSLILRGEVPWQEKLTGLAYLQQSSNYGFSISKLILGITYLDGVDISYNCQKAVQHIREGLLNVNTWADKAEEAKIAIKKHKYHFALIKYLQLSLAGSSVGLVNGIYLLEMYLRDMETQVWNAKEVESHPLHKYLSTSYLQKIDAAEFMFDDLLQIVSKYQLVLTLASENKKPNAYREYVRTKLLAICKNGGVSICMFLSYKQSPDNRVLLQDLAKREGDKLHLLESRFLLGKLYQQNNSTENAVIEYSRATSSLIAPLLLFIEGYNLQLKIIDDLLLLLTGVAIFVAGSVIHRNMILLKRHKEQEKRRNEQEQEAEDQPDFKEEETEELREKQD